MGIEVHGKGIDIDPEQKNDEAFKKKWERILKGGKYQFRESDYA